MDGIRSANVVTLVGLDFGSTTSSMLAVDARITSNCLTGRMQLGDLNVIRRPEPVFTPFKGCEIDLVSLRSQVEFWLRNCNIVPSKIFAGGAIVTGLAAQRSNAEVLTGLVGELLGEAVVATADDPRLESWLAFMGSSAALSRANPDRTFLNFDIGGGTTNPAIGVAGNVRATGCYFVGARHFEFARGGYRLVNLSRYGSALLEHLGIERSLGCELSKVDVDRVTSYFVNALAAVAEGERGYFDNPVGRLIEQSPFVASIAQSPILTFSGGVGELIYALARGIRAPDTTYYGDLGVDLAEAILANNLLSRDVSTHVPEHRGRATLQGLTISNTEISGTTLFLGSDDALPLRNLPILATLSSSVEVSELVDSLKLMGRSHQGACLQLVWQHEPQLQDVKRLAAALGEAFEKSELALDATLVVITNSNVAKALGNYATAWRSSGRKLAVIDEISERVAQFVNLGRMQNGIVPVSFYGLNSDG